MTTQVIFRMDEGLKNKLAKKAQTEGVTLSSIFNHAAKAYIEGDIILRMTTKEVFKKSVQRELKKSIEDLAKGRNLSKAFDNAEEAIRYLKAL